MSYWNTKNNAIQNVSQVLNKELCILPTVICTIIEEYFGNTSYLQIGAQMTNAENIKTYFTFNLEFEDIKIYKAIKGSCLDYFIESINLPWALSYYSDLDLYCESKFPFCEDIVLKFSYNTQNNKHQVICKCGKIDECGETCDCRKMFYCKCRCKCAWYCDFCMKYNVIIN